MKSEGIKLFILIEASKLADDSVTIDTWEAQTATKMLDVYAKRKKWNDENEERYHMRTAFQFRKVVLYPHSEAVCAWRSSLEEVKEIAESENKS
jgi:hypothetical protein